jgi:xanthine dehydrogenase YagS FAD-binding subunit
LDSALDELSKPGRVAKAGGVDLVDLMKEGLAAPDRVVSLSAVTELRGVRPTQGGGLAIGALTTLAEIAAHEAIRSKWTALALAADHAATPQLRNMATLGGNLVQRPRCWYFRSEEFHCRKKGGAKCFAQDGQNQFHAIFGNRLCAIVHPSTPSTALVALGAKVHLAGPKKRRSVDIEDFFVDADTDLKRENVRRDDEIITHVELAPLGDGWRSVYRKQQHKQSFDWPIADVAIAAKMDGDVCEEARVALGAAAPVPLRAERAERAIQRQRLTPDVRETAAHAAMRGATPLPMNGYKVAVFETVVRRLLEELAS